MFIWLLSFPGSGSGCSWPTVCCPPVPTAPSYTSFRSQTGKLEHREVKGHVARCLCQSTFSYILPVYMKTAWTESGDWKESLGCTQDSWGRLLW